MAAYHYYEKHREFDVYRIRDLSQIRKRWFRHYYVIVQQKGTFTFDHYVYKFGDPWKFPLIRYRGIWFGPFWTQEEAESFGHTYCEYEFNWLTG